MSDTTQPTDDEQIDWKQDAAEGAKAALDLSTTLTTTIIVDPETETDEIIFVRIDNANKSFSLAQPEAIQQMLERAGLTITEPMTIVLVTSQTHTRISEINVEGCTEDILIQGLERLGLATLRDQLVESLSQMPSADDVKALAQHIVVQSLNSAIEKNPMGDGLQLPNPEDITVMGAPCAGCGIVFPALRSSQLEIVKIGGVNCHTSGQNEFRLGMFSHENPFSRHLNTQIAGQVKAALPDTFKEIARTWAGEHQMLAQVLGRVGRKVAAHYGIPQHEVDHAADAARDARIAELDAQRQKAQAAHPLDELVKLLRSQGLPGITGPIPDHVRQIFEGLGAQVLFIRTDDDPTGQRLGGWGPFDEPYDEDEAIRRAERLVDPPRRRDNTPRPTGPQAR